MAKTATVIKPEAESEFLRAKHMAEISLINMIDMLQFNHRMELSEPVLNALIELSSIIEDDPAIQGLTERPRVN